ncbi:MAG: formate dehydrogenase subunit delta [Acidimicrobiales bacterium]
MTVHQEAPYSNEAELQRMANQIAANYAHHDFEVAAGEVATHVKLFWTPQMRADLAAMSAGSAWELHPLVLRAVNLMGDAPV